MIKRDMLFWMLTVSFIFGVALNWPVWCKFFVVIFSGGVLSQVSNRLFKAYKKQVIRMPSKYESQQKNLRKNYVRFPLDLKPDILAAFRQACKANGTTPTTEIKKFISQYIEIYVQSTKAGE